MWPAETSFNKLRLEFFKNSSLAAERSRKHHLPGAHDRRHATKAENKAAVFAGSGK
jgi:hypothetical protein